MMTASSLLSCGVNTADGAPPAQPALPSFPDASRPGDFQDFMGQAQAGQSAAPGAIMPVPVLPPPSNPSDPSDPPDPSDPSHPKDPSTPSKSSHPAIDSSIAGLVLAMLAQMPKEQISRPNPAGSLQNVPPGDAGPGLAKIEAQAGRAVLGCDQCTLPSYSFTAVSCR